MLKRLIPFALLFLASPVLADAPQVVQQQVEATLAAAPDGIRFGLLVVDESGKTVVAVNPDQRFIPASNTKMFTTAAAYALLPGMDQPDANGGTEVYLLPGKAKRAPNVLLVGRGDALMSSAPDCTIDCLAALADAVAARTRQVGDVIGDDTRFPDQRWSPGMSWNNIGSNDATAASALSLDSNELTILAAPAARGEAPHLVIPAYVTVVNEAVTIDPGGKNTLALEHPVNSREFRLYGEIPSDTGEWNERIGVDDPAHFTAWTLAAMLRARGVRVNGQVRSAHRPVNRIDDPRWRDPAMTVAAPDADPAATLARLVPPPLGEDVVIINKVSQNHHAEQLLRRIGSVHGLGSLQDGLAAEYDLFQRIGLPRAGYDFYDGSGMSTYNRVSPRAAVALLRWIDGQPWAAAWYGSLPIAGRDGTLKRRFIGTPLEGNLAAKTGTLNATNALSGTFRTASGRRFVFAFFANDVPDGATALPTMEAVLARIATAN
ncbi:MAG: D-alanyl-D-alanine carboxypeptidase/D-alanyl-D-alanine-endopeptidase [Novosphingobium sp.]